MNLHLYIVSLLVPLQLFSQMDSVEIETGTASYYANGFEGRKCSSGDIFRHSALTAAHKKIKFGTLVKVTNLKNDSVVVVRINDRLPKESKRCIDLTKTAARQLNFLMQGLTKVKIEIIKNVPGPLDSLQVSGEKKE